MIIDHIGFAVKNHEISRKFYSQSLTPLGIKLIAEDQGWSGFGRPADGKAEFWFGEDDKPQGPMHIAFLAESREMVNQFYKAAITAGAKDNGKPGLRDIYHSNYYAAFVIDPDGHNIEAVYHGEDQSGA